VAIGVLRGSIQERLQMLIDHAVQHAVLGGAGLIRGKVGHADDIGAESRRRLCREMDTPHPWGRACEGRRASECLFPGTAAFIVGEGTTIELVALQ
jgi:hypothetical protein